MILRTRGTVRSVWFGHQAEGDITVYVQFIHPETGRQVTRKVTRIPIELCRRLRKGDVIPIRINTAVPLPIRSWFYDG